MQGPVGATLDKVYRVDRLLGRGGMGAVYGGHDTSLGRDVAIKVLHPHFADDPAFAARFRQEARAIASLNHPGVVQVYACGEDLGLLYIVMDYVSGPTLDTWLKRLADEHKIVALEESLRIVRRVAMAVHYAHEKGVLHRDIKPANIILRPVDPALQEAGDLPFQPVLTDFGLARLAEGTVHTQTGMAMGTPTYMSPEQCLGVAVDRRTDVYALGILVYELSTGRVPFAVKTLTEAMRAHTQEPPPPPRTVNPNLPVEVEDAILRALAKRKEDRYPTARALADALRSALTSMPGGLVVTPVLPGSPDAAVTPPPRRVPRADTYATSAAVRGDLEVTMRDGSTRRVVMGAKQTLTIGRTEDNDLQLQDVKVSRRHARIDVDGPDLLVVDLHSTNGTYLGDSRLLAGVPVRWLVGTPLHIGDCTIHVTPAAAPAMSSGPPSGTVIDARSRFGGASMVYVAEAGFDLQVQAGGRVSTTFTATNAGPRVDHFETTVSGVPPAWVAEKPPVVRLLPNDRRELALSFAPPRSPQSWADSYPVTVRVASQTDPSQAAEVSGVLRVQPYYEWTLGLYPQRQTGSAEGAFELRLENQGNAPLDVELSATDPEAMGLYAFSPPRVTVAAASREIVRLSVRAHRPLAAGTTATCAFVVVARAPQSPVPEKQVQGQWVHTAPPPQPEPQPTPVPRATPAPRLEAALLPERQSTAGTATFQVEIANRGNAGTEVTVEAAERAEQCSFAVKPARVTVPAGGKRAVSIEVTSKTAARGRDPIVHPFGVTVRAVDPAVVPQRLQGEWTQLGVKRAIWPRVLLIMLGWAIAWIAYWMIRDVFFLIRGAVLGGIGGWFTGLAVRWGERRGRQVFFMIVIWAMAWALGSVGLAVSPYSPLWVLAGAVVGLIGGNFTARVLHGVSLPAVTWAWAIGWAAALVMGTGLFAGQTEIYFYYDFGSTIISAIMVGVLVGLIAGTITMRQARRAGLL